MLPIYVAPSGVPLWPFAIRYDNRWSNHHTPPQQAAAVNLVGGSVHVVLRSADSRRRLPLLTRQSALPPQAVGSQHRAGLQSGIQLLGGFDTLGFLLRPSWLLRFTHAQARVGRHGRKLTGITRAALCSAHERHHLMGKAHPRVQATPARLLLRGRIQFPISPATGSADRAMTLLPRPSFAPNRPRDLSGSA
jgi:hypothetical protein